MNKKKLLLFIYGTIIAQWRVALAKAASFAKYRSRAGK